ncbi:unnamed protein product [Prorocentrum cordatum]|uniref:Uncharacterized protein n=1 Tax=Prorocentrum cordatum TaxID=2364126 RepID=A0ABN9UTT2_9DINO|nr:unnamed protein product [Polarella glacialis]
MLGTAMQSKDVGAGVGAGVGTGVGRRRRRRHWRRRRGQARALAIAALVAVPAGRVLEAAQARATGVVDDRQAGVDVLHQLALVAVGGHVNQPGVLVERRRRKLCIALEQACIILLSTSAVPPRGAGLRVARAGSGEGQPEGG